MFDRRHEEGGQGYDRLSDGTPSGIAGQQGQQSHLGRDAALAGGAGTAAYEGERHHGHHGHHHDNRRHEEGGQQYDRLSDGTPSGIALPGQQSNTGSSNIAPGSGMSQPGQTGTGHHYGRDAAAAGGLGAAGYEAEQLRKGHYNSSSGLPSDSTNFSHPRGPANDSDNYGALPGDLGANDPRRSGAQTGMQSGSTSNTGDRSHLGRDAGLAAGAAGLAGEGMHHHNHNSGERGLASGLPDRTRDNYGSTGNIQPGEGLVHAGHTHEFRGPNEERHHVGFASGPHVTDTANRLDPHIPGGGQSGHHYGRDAAGVAGVGAAGAGAYELSNDRTGPASSTIGPHSSNAMNVVDPRVQPDPAMQGSQHHYGRDAAMVGGGAAATGVAGHEFSKHDAEKQEKMMLKEEKAEQKQDHRLEKEHEKQEKKLEKEHHHHDKDEKKPGLMDRLLHHNKKHDNDNNSGDLRRMHEDYDFEGATQPDYIATHPERLREGGQMEMLSAGGQAEQMDNYNSEHHHNKLHKDPPANVQRELEGRARQEGNVGNTGTSTSTTSGYPTQAHDAIPPYTGSNTGSNTGARQF